MGQVVGITQILRGKGPGKRKEDRYMDGGRVRIPVTQRQQCLVLPCEPQSGAKLKPGRALENMAGRTWAQGKRGGGLVFNVAKFWLRQMKEFQRWVVVTATREGTESSRVP